MLCDVFLQRKIIFFWKFEGFPTARRCLGLARYENFVYITGGTNGVELFDDIWQYNITNFSWTRLKAFLPQRVFFHSTTTTKVKLTSELFTVSNKKWFNSDTFLFSGWMFVFFRRSFKRGKFGTKLSVASALAVSTFVETFSNGTSLFDISRIWHWKH